MIAKLNRSRKGFTLIELLVVVLILAILMAVALPLYLDSVRNAELRTCRANMQTVANAVQAKKVSSRLSDYSTLIGAAVSPATLPDLQSGPICPTTQTNSYSIAQGSSGDDTTYEVACTATGHGSFEPGVDAE